MPQKQSSGGFDLQVKQGTLIERRDGMSVAVLSLFFLGFISLVAGGDTLVKGAAGLAKLFRISPLAIGLTVMAFGTSSPELAVSVRSVLSDHIGISIGNILGSNIYNILLVLGISALVTPLSASKQLVRFDVPIMIIASLIIPLMAWDGWISRLEGCVLVCGLGVYTYWSFSRGRSTPQEATDPDPDIPSHATWASRDFWIQIFYVMLGLGLLVLGSKWLIDGAIEIATYLGVSELVIGLTVIAIGTSLPEIVTSVMAIYHGERDMAVGNVVGSNIFNLLGVLGVTGMVAKTDIPFPKEALHFDIPVMTAVAIACLPVFFTGNRISRWEGGLFLFYFVTYTAFLFLDAMGSQHLRTFSLVMVVFVMPLTVITLLVSTFRGAAFRNRQD